MSMCRMGTPRWKRPKKKGRDHQKRGRRGHHWQKLFGKLNGMKIKIGIKCKNCGKEHIIPELRGATR